MRKILCAVSFFLFGLSTVFFLEKKPQIHWILFSRWNTGGGKTFVGSTTLPRMLAEGKSVLATSMSETQRNTRPPLSEPAADGSPMLSTPPHDSTAHASDPRQRRNTLPLLKPPTAPSSRFFHANSPFEYEYPEHPPTTQLPRRDDHHGTKSTRRNCSPAHPTASGTPGASQGRRQEVLLAAGPAAVMATQRSSSAPPAPQAPSSPSQPPSFAGPSRPQLLQQCGKPLIKPLCRRGASAPPPSTSPSASPSPTARTGSDHAMLNINGKKRGAELLVDSDSLVCYGLRYNVLPVEAMLDYACNIAEEWQHVESIGVEERSDSGCSENAAVAAGAAGGGGCAVDVGDGGRGSNGYNENNSKFITLATPVKLSPIVPPSPPTAAPPPTPAAGDCVSDSKAPSSLVADEIQDALIREVDRPARVAKLLQDINAIGAGWGTVQWSAVKHIDFSAGKLRSLAGIDIFANLETIIVDNNLLDSLDSAGTIPSVKTLSLNFNAVYGLDAVLSCIRDKFPKVTFLSLLGNPCCASELYGSTANQYETYCNKVAEVLTDLKFLDSSSITRKAPKERPIKNNLLTAAKSLRSGNLLEFADAMTKTVVLSGKHAGNQSKQMTMKMLKEVTIAARSAVSTSTNTLVAMGDNVSTRLLGLEPTVVQALVQPPDLESIPLAGGDMLSWATRKRELGIISLEEYKHFVRTANAMNVEARELAVSNHYLAIDRLEALIHPEEVDGDRAVISVGDDGFSKKMTEGGGLDGAGGKKYTHHDLPPELDTFADGMLDELATSVEGLSQFSNLSYV